MNQSKPYNPLDKAHLGESVANAMLASQPEPLNGVGMFSGAGIYAIYYKGSFPPYRPISSANPEAPNSRPIYVGKAVPAGARKGGFGLGINPGTALASRLKDHAKSVDQAENISLDDFCFQHLVVDDIWIPLGESLLISMFSPIWNTFVDGFGNHDPGKGRYNQVRSRWDVLHPGRNWALKCAERSENAEQISAELQSYLSNE